MLFVTSAAAQEDREIEQIIENTAENSNEEKEDDELLQMLSAYNKNPVDLNKENLDDLKNFPFLTFSEIEELKNYKMKFGKLISLYELQAVPQWDVETIKKILPFVTLDKNVAIPPLGKRLKGGVNFLLLRISRTLELSKGFFKSGSSSYQGSPEKVFFKYRYNHKNLLQINFTGEKDAGEKFFQKRSPVFDFYSFHLTATNFGKIKRIILGDFTANMSQGLIQWQSFSLGKGPDVVSVKKQSSVIRPYSSTDENNFMRGTALNIEWKKIDFNLFGSLNKHDANIDSNNNITSLQTSGYHRSENEIKDKNSAKILTLGGSAAIKKNGFFLQFNYIHRQLSVATTKNSDFYKSFKFSGNKLSNYSFEISKNLKNFHFFSEVAKGGKGFGVIAGSLVSLSSNVSLATLYRDIGKEFISLNGSAFTESTKPEFEKGLFTGINIKLVKKVTLSAYSDIFWFPFFRYRVNGSSSGYSALLQVNFKPDKNLEIYGYLRSKMKGGNVESEDEKISGVSDIQKQNLRINFWYRFSPDFSITNRIEVVNFFSAKAEDGFAAYSEITYKPFGRKLSGNLRVLYFETGSYDSRIYTYEKDVGYSSSIPSFFDKGYRTVLNLKYKYSNKLTFWLKLSQTVYADKTSLGSGNDMIMGSKKTDVKIQASLEF